MNYPMIGATVSYARALPEGVIATGSGRVQAIFLNTEKRVMVQVVDVLSPSEVFNVDLAMVGADDDKIALYEAVTNRVRALSDEGNAKVKEVVEQYNAMVNAEYELVLGAAVEWNDGQQGTDGSAT